MCRSANVSLQRPPSSGGANPTDRTQSADRHFDLTYLSAAEAGSGRRHSWFARARALVTGGRSTVWAMPRRVTPPLGDSERDRF